MDDYFDSVWQHTAADFTSILAPEWLLRAPVRLLMATVLGGILGLERSKHGKAAGLRTHVLVCLASAFFVLVPQLIDSTSLELLSRVIQGMLTGMGFIGAGTILKLNDEQHIRGLTTASSLWMTTAIGLAAGTGNLTMAIIGTALTLAVLTALFRLEAWQTAHLPASARDDRPNDADRDEP